MLVAKEGNSEINSLYKYFTISNTEGQIVPYETDTLEELDAQVEKMLNGDYKKKDLLIVQVSDFNINSDLFEEIENAEDTEITP